MRVYVVNSGKRSVQITSIMIETSERRILQIIPDNFPVVLQPLTSADAEIQKEWIDQESISLFGVIDALGNRYSLNDKQLKKLLNNTNCYPSNKNNTKEKMGLEN